MSVELNFDARQVEPDAGFELLPAGWYNAQITASELKPTANGEGAYLNFEFSILDGQYVGRKVFQRYNIRNNNQEAVSVAYRQLSAVGHAVRVVVIQNTAQLHGIPLKIKLKIRKDKTGQYEDQNEISGYKEIESNQPQFPQVGGFEQAPAGAPPWAQQAPAQPQAPAGAPPSEHVTQQAIPPWAQAK